jgi:hypothetical protein
LDRRRFLRYAAGTALAGAAAVGGLYYLGQRENVPERMTTPSTESTTPAVTELQTVKESSESTSASVLSPSTQEIYRRIKVPENGCYLGAYIGDFPSIQQINEFGNKTGRKLAILEMYFPFFEYHPDTNITSPSNFPTDYFEECARNGHTVLINWKPAGWDVTNLKDVNTVTLEDIIHGKHDSYLEMWAEDARRFNYPFFLRFAWEMNGNWERCSGPNNFGPNGDLSWDKTDDLNKYYGDPTKPDGPERYIDAWRHVHDVFRNIGASNAMWVWGPNFQSQPDVPWNTCENYYPGDEHVDWIGFSLYNHGYFGDLPSWRSFDTLFNMEPIESYRKHDKPFMLGEWGCSQKMSPSMDGPKDQWITDAFDKIRNKYLKIRGACWFSVDKTGYASDERDWRVDSSAQALSAYRKAIQDPYFLDTVLFED